MRQVFLNLLRDGDLYVIEKSPSVVEKLWSWWLGAFEIDEGAENFPTKAYREYKGTK